MELSLQHEHPNNQVQTVSPKTEPAKSVKNSNKIVQVCTSPEKPQTLFFVPILQPQVSSSFNFHIDGLEEILKDSKNELENSVVQAISSRKSFSQQRIYQAIVNTSYDFVGVHLKQMGKGLKLQLQTMFQTIHNSVEAGIWDGQYEINKRNNYLTANRREQELVSYITEELVKRNIENFRQELDETEANELFSSPHFTRSQIEKKRQAEDFVKRIKQEQQKHREYMRKLKEERESLEVRSMEQQRMKEQQKKREHQTAVRRRIERYSQLKTKENEHKKKIHEEYIQFVSSVKKPLFKEIEERFEKRKAEAQKQKLRRMRQLMEQRKPMSFEEINQHMERYQELLRQNQQYRQQKRQLKQSQMEIIASRRPYRSKFYSLVVESEKKTIQPESKTALIQRQSDFADYVKKKFVPKIDESKQQELQRLIKRITSQKKAGFHSRKYIEEGKRNLEKLHLLIGELRAKNKIKEPKPMSDSQIPSTAIKYVNYIEEVKKSRIHKAGTQSSIDYEKKLENKDHEELKLQALRREAKARHKDHYLDSSMDVMDFDTHMQSRTAVENDYLQAARAKAAILKKYSLEKGSSVEDKVQ